MIRRVLALLAACALSLSLSIATRAAGAAVPDVGLVVEVGQNVTLSLHGFEPKKGVRLWLLVPPTLQTFCVNQAMPQGVCGLDVGTWRADARGAATVSFRWPSYFCVRGTRTNHCRRSAWRHGMSVTVAAYSADLFFEAETHVTVR
jgi:hypothetical protein